MSSTTRTRTSSGESTRVGPIRKGKKLIDFNKDDSKVDKLRERILSTASNTDININTTLAEEREEEEEGKIKPVPLRNFIVGTRSDTRNRPNNYFLKTGYSGSIRKVRSTPNLGEHSRELMKTSVGFELRKEDTKYSTNMVKALSSRGHIMGKRILFMGSGCAKVINKYFSRGPQSVMCVDNNPEKIRQLRTMTDNFGYSSFVSSICCSVTDTKKYVKCGDSFDTIIITKSMGAICTSTGERASSILKIAKEMLSEDGVVFVDSQTGEAPSGGKLSRIFGGQDRELATVWGRYDDIVYNVENEASEVKLSVRESFKLALRRREGPLSNSLSQIWSGFILGKEQDIHIPLIPKMSTHQNPIKLKKFDLVMKGGVDMLPKGTNGVKLVPWKGISEQVTRFPIYPKFDGISGTLICTDSMATFSSKVVTMAMSTPKLINDYIFLTELCRVDIENQQKHWVPVILGVISINGIKYDPNDLTVLEREKTNFEQYLNNAGILITGPNMLFSLKGDIIRYQCLTPDSKKRIMEIPVDGLNVFIGGGYGNFLKPAGKITLDIDSNRVDNFEKALQMVDYEDFSLGDIQEGVWEYKLNGMKFVPYRKRGDKDHGNGTVRTAQDINSLIKTSELFSYVKTTSGLYEYLIDQMNTYQPTRKEEKNFFTHDWH